MSGCSGFDNRQPEATCQAMPLHGNLFVQEPGRPAKYRCRSSINECIGDLPLSEVAQEIAEPKTAFRDRVRGNDLCGDSLPVSMFLMIYKL